VRVCHEVVGTGAIGFAGRGIERRVIPPFEKFPEVCLGCGACSFVCPTGTMKMEYEATKQFRDIPGSDRLCRYARMQVIPYKLCSNNYQCRHCEVDQLMEDRFGTHPVIATKPITRKMKQYVGEFSFMPDRYYWRGHVWMRFLNGKVQVGLDDFARRILSCIDEIRLPPSDRTIGRFEKAWEIACGSKRATMLLPIAGRISDVNPDVLDVPELIERDPYGRGWILTVEPTNIQDEILHLYDGSSKQVYDWLTLESDKLHRLIKTKTRVIMTDGGVLQSDLPNRLTDDEWTTLTKEFFLH
jgi:glycine cleavage system H lipoate-binding protein